MTWNRLQSSRGSGHARSRWKSVRPTHVTALLLVLIASAMAHPAFAPLRPTTPPGRIAVQLGGAHVGFVSAAAGGGAFGEVVSVKTDALFSDKSISNLQFEPIVIEFGPGMSRAWFDWLTQAFQGKAQPKDGTLLFLDYENRVQSKLEFSRAAIAEVTFPALDGAAKDKAFMTATLLPEKTLSRVGDKSGYADSMRFMRSLSSSAFRLTIGGLESATNKALMIDALTIKFPGPRRGVIRGSEAATPTAIEVSNLNVTVPQSAAEPFSRWHEEFVVKGVQGPEREKAGTLEWLSADRRTVLGSLDLFSVGIFRLGVVESGDVPRVKAEMYCERIVPQFRGLGVATQ